MIFGDKRARDKCLAKLVGCVQEAISSKKNYDEMLYGRVSMLYALCFVENELANDPAVRQELESVMQLENCKRQVVQRMLVSGAEGRQSQSRPLLNYHYAWHGKEYCGKQMPCSLNLDFKIFYPLLSLINSLIDPLLFSFRCRSWVLWNFLSSAQESRLLHSGTAEEPDRRLSASGAKSVAQERQHDQSIGWQWQRSGSG